MNKKHMMAEMAALKKGKAPKKVMASEKAEYGMKMGGPVAYAKGGLAMVKKGGKSVPAFAADGKGKMNMGGAVKARQSATSKGKAC